MNFKVKYFIIGFFICMLSVWMGSLIKCEMLTRQHYDEFKNAYRQNTMLGDMEYFKVLRYSPYYTNDFAQVYYITKGNKSGHVLTFKLNYDTDLWEEISWTTIWSTNGSASEVIYPYWWHFIYGGF